MKTKVVIKSENVIPFGGIFYVMDEFPHLGMDRLIDRVLGLRCGTCGYQYSEILSSLFYTYYCGGDRVEDDSEGIYRIKTRKPYQEIPLSIYCSTRKMDKNGKKMDLEYLFSKTVSFIMANLTSVF